MSTLDPATGSGPRRWIEAHLGSRDVARVVYGSIIGLALVVALEQHPPTATQAMAAVLATGVAVGLAEVYSEYVGTAARTRRHVRRAELHALIGDATAVLFGACFPALFFFLAAVGAMELDSAFTLAKWSGFVLICLYGFVGARLAGSGNAHAFGHALALGLIGGALIALKAVLH
jgi:hypothetical protein